MLATFARRSHADLPPPRVRDSARRLLLSEATSAESVAYRVGYASASQFNREDVRLFGQPPRSDAERLRSAASNLPASKHKHAG